MDNRSNRKNKNRRSRRSARVVATVLAALMIFSTMGSFANAEEVTGSTETAAVEEPEEVSIPSDEDSSTIDVDDTVPDEEAETPTEGEGETDTPTVDSGEENSAKQNDLIVDEEEAEEADTSEEDQKAEASTFTISWSVFGNQRILYYVHAVDEDGQEVNIPDAKDVTIGSDKMNFSFGDYALSADGYAFKEAKLDKTDGSVVTDVKLSVTGSALSVTYKNGEEDVEDTSVSLTDDNAKETRDIYFIYEKESQEGSITGSSDNYEVTLEYGADAGIPEGSTVQVTEYSEDSEEYKNASDAVFYATFNGTSPSGTSTDESREDLTGEETAADTADNTSGMKALDISIMDGDTPIEPKEGAEVTVTIKMKSLPDDMVSDSVIVSHIKSDGTVEEVLNSDKGTKTVEDGSLVMQFTTTSFSTFTISWDKDITNSSFHLYYLSGTSSESTIYANITIHYTDKNGQPIPRPSSLSLHGSGNSAYLYSTTTDSERFDLTDYSYNNTTIHYGSIDGTEVSSVRFYEATNGRHYAVIDTGSGSDAVNY